GVLTIDTISVTIGSSGGTSVLRADILYSTDPTFATSTQLGTTITLGNASYTRVKFSALNIVLNPGQSIYVRILPWNSSAAAITGKYLAILNMAIGGSSVPIPVASGIIWPCISDVNSGVSTGTIIAGTTTLNNLTNYGSQTYNGINGQSLYTGTVWQAESAPAEGRYIQFVASPKSGGTLVVDSVRMKLAAWATPDFRVSVYYSKDPAFTLSSGIQLRNDIAVSNGTFSKTLSTLRSNNTFNSGESMYLRLYPYHITTSGDQWKLLGLDSIAVFGKVTGITADPPTVSSTAISGISTTFVSTGGNITTDGGAAVTDRGIVYSSTSTSPTITDSKIQTGTGSGIFTTQLSGLTAGTTYYARAYATNSAGTSYGTVLTFTTMAVLTVPVVTTTAVTSILAITANSGGNVSDWGGSTVSARGICWSTSPLPTIANSVTTNGNGIGSYSCSFCSLSPSTIYYVRAFATNDTGTGYGAELTFSTQATAPDVEKTVNKDGSGDYTTIQAAFSAVPDNYSGRWIIHVKPGTYYEKCTLASTKSNVFLIGEDAATTI
ncbi:MAG: pectinesterase family protein, partial [Bacteroidota bacterium]